MTYLEKYMQEHPERNTDIIVKYCCPDDMRGNLDCYGYAKDKCQACWNQEIPEAKPIVYAHLGPDFTTVTDVKEENGGMTVTDEPTIKDSGDRTEFATGAVRDMREGKGRCDLMPLDVVAAFIAEYENTSDPIIDGIYEFQHSNSASHLYCALNVFCREAYLGNDCTMFLEVAKHFEEGAKKYGESNWKRGIPTWCYIDSAVRHYLKWLRGDKDEPHDRAFVWNILCCIWTIEHEDELKECHNG